VTLVPTCIDLRRYPVEPPKRRPGAPFAIGWIGSPATSPNLGIISEAWRQFVSRHDAELIAVGCGSLPEDLPRARAVEWTESTEVDEIARFDVGIMPLIDTPFARGKCAFKLVQYMG